MTTGSQINPPYTRNHYAARNIDETV